ncbi:MAG: phosphoglucomutase/phosphomannomutase family protein [Candidatus Bathyarchaeia archaeon]
MEPIRFGTDGWRGIMGRDFTFERVKLVAQAIADYLTSRGLAERGVVVGYDTRRWSRRFAEGVSSVMLGNGIRTYMTVRDTPTPAAAFEVLHLRAGGAVMITASHNPPEWNGVKYIPYYAGPALPDVTDELTTRIRELQLKDVKEAPAEQLRGSGLFELVDPLEPYVVFVEKQLDLQTIREAHLRVVCDPMHGTSRGYLDRLLQEAGCDVQLIRAEPDPDFGGHRPEPVPEYLVELKARVQASGAELGFATDGDADRLAVYDSDGSYLAANDLLPVLFEHLLRKSRRGGLVRSVATTHLADRIAESHGLPVYEVPVGFKHVGQYLREKDVVIGAEESGGFSFKGHISEKDGILACLMVAEARAYAGKPLRKLLEELFAKYGRHLSGRISVPSSPRDLEASLTSLSAAPPERIAGRRVVGVNRLDGVKLLLEDGSWLLIRPSGTEPIVRVYAESTDRERLTAILEAGKTLLQK